MSHAVHKITHFVKHVVKVTTHNLPSLLGAGIGLATGGLGAAAVGGLLGTMTKKPKMPSVPQPQPLQSPKPQQPSVLGTGGLFNYPKIRTDFAQGSKVKTYSLGDLQSLLTE